MAGTKEHAEIVYEIVDWNFYEVNDKSGAWRPGDRRRQKPLAYVRMPVNDSKQTPGYRRLMKNEAWVGAAAFGLFHKLLEVSGNLPAELRGFVVRKQIAGGCSLFTLEELSERVGFPAEVVERCLSALCGCGWLVEIAPGEFSAVSGARVADRRMEEQRIPGLRVPTKDEGLVALEPVFVEELQSMFRGVDVPSALGGLLAQLRDAPEGKRPLAKHLKRYLRKAIANTAQEAG